MPDEPKNKNSSCNILHTKNLNKHHLSHHSVLPSQACQIGIAAGRRNRRAIMAGDLSSILEVFVLWSIAGTKLKNVLDNDATRNDFIRRMVASDSDAPSGERE